MMHVATDSVSTSPMLANDIPDSVTYSPSLSSSNPFDQYEIIRRNGPVAAFEPARISIALTKAYIAVNGSQGAASARDRAEMIDLKERENFFKPASPDIRPVARCPGVSIASHSAKSPKDGDISRWLAGLKV